MKTREAPDFEGLNKNMDCEFPLKQIDSWPIGINL